MPTAGQDDAGRTPATGQPPVSIEVAGGGSVEKLTVISAVHGDVIIASGQDRRRTAADERALSRRSLFKRFAATVGAGLSVSQLEAVDAARGRAEETLTHGTVSKAALERWERGVAEHLYGYATRAPLPLLGEVLLDVTDVQELLAECRSPRAQRSLIRVLGRLCGIAGVLVDDLGATREARSWLRTTRVAADEVGDRGLHAWAYAREAFFLLHYNRLGAGAVELARTAATVAGTRPCAAYVMAPTVEARALAMLGADRDAVRALNRATDAFEHVAGTPQRGLFGWSRQQLVFSEGRTLTTLGHTREAIASQDLALRMFPPGEILDPALVNLDRAQALIRSGDLTEGCRMGAQVLRDLPPAYRSPLIASWSDDALGAIPAAHRDSPAARDFQLVRDVLLRSPDDVDR